jgi:hypothetical protein
MVVFCMSVGGYQVVCQVPASSVLRRIRMYLIFEHSYGSEGESNRNVSYGPD